MAGQTLKQKEHEAIFKEMYSRRSRPERRCRVCGCTTGRACDGGCWWVEVDLCSRCRT